MAITDSKTGNISGPNTAAKPVPPAKPKGGKKLSKAFARPEMQWLLSAAVGTPLVYCFFQFYHIDLQPAAFWLSLLAAAVLIRRAVQVKARGTIVFSAVFSVLMAFTQLVGSKINFAASSFGDFSVFDFTFSFPALALLFYSVIACVTDVLLLHPIRRRAGEAKAPFLLEKGLWPISSLIVAILWLPAYFSYYPGILSNDSMNCLSRAMGDLPITSQEPVFYQFLLHPFVLFGRIARDINVGVACYSMTQLVIMAVIVGYALSWLYKKGCPLVFVILSLLYFVLNPIFSVYAVTMWDEVLFSGLLLLYLLFFYDILSSHGENLKTTFCFVRFLILNLLIAFLGMKGLVIVIVMLALLTIYLRAQFKWRGVAFLAVILFSVAVQGPFFLFLNIPSTPFADEAGVPLQQVARTVAANGKVSSQQSAFLNKIMPSARMKTAYTPFSADGVKLDGSFNNKLLNENKLDFMKTWLGMMGPNMKEYSQAYAMQTSGYWYMGAQGKALSSGVSDYNGKLYGVHSNDLIKDKTGQDFQKLLTDYYNGLSSFPLTAPLFSIAFLMWLTVFCAFLLILKKKKRFLPAVLPFLLLWVSALAAAPGSSDFRLALPFAAALPFVVLPALFQKLEETETKAKAGKVPAKPARPAQPGKLPQQPRTAAGSQVAARTLAHNVPERRPGASETAVRQ